MNAASRALPLLLAAGLSAGCMNKFYPDNWGNDRNAGRMLNRDITRPVDLARINEQIRPGDIVHLTTTRGKDYRFRVRGVAADAFTGVHGNGKHYRIPYKAIRAIGVRDVKSGGEVAEDVAIFSADTLLAIIGAAALFFCAYGGCFD